MIEENRKIVKPGFGTTTLGEKIREARINIGMSQETLAKAVGITKAAISKYENGIVTNIPLDKISTMASVLSVPPAYLLGLDINVEISDKVVKSNCFKDRLAQALESRNMSQADLVRVTGLCKSGVSSWLAGRWNPKYDVIKKIAVALDCSESWLAGYDEPITSINREPSVPTIEMEHGAIYEIRDTLTDRVYVGASMNVEQRISHHFWALENGSHLVEDMQADYNDHKDRFVARVVDHFNDDRSDKEYSWMVKNLSYIRGIGYNYKDPKFKGEIKTEKFSEIALIQAIQARDIEKSILIACKLVKHWVSEQISSNSQDRR